MRGFLLVLLIVCGSTGVACQTGEMNGESKPLNPVIVVFADGLVISAQGDAFRAEPAKGATGLPEGRALEAALESLNQRIASEEVLAVRSVFPKEAATGEHAAEVQRIWSVTLEPSASEATLEALAKALQENALVEESYVQPTPEDAGGDMRPGGPPAMD